MSLAQLQGIIGGELIGDAQFNAVSTDTRTLQPGELFVALKGPNFNGNAFVAQAEQRQACAALVTEKVISSLPTLEVSDTRLALGKIAANNRIRSRAKVLALTGSQGKTSVKEMTASILSQCGEVLYTQGNLNNDYGVPLTLLRLGSWHEYAVIELGASSKGEIAYTTRMVNPDIALINNVAATHVEGFGSLQGVAEGKAEIWQGLSGGGTALINIDDENVLALSPEKSAIKKVSFSASGKNADYRLSGIEQSGLQGSSFDLHSPVGSARVKIKAPGLHNVSNALAAIALSMEAGASLEHVVTGLANMQVIKGRLQIRQGIKGSVILDDSYNASPTSFRAAIDVLATLPGTRVVVAGDMGELGEAAEIEHRNLGEYAASKGIDFFCATGELSILAVKSFGDDAVHAENCEKLSEILLKKLAPGVSVLVKGSRSAGMERVVKQLTEQGD